jgi:DNA-binding transcriptional MerR regulator/effector-binding domain-containing protein
MRAKILDVTSDHDLMGIGAFARAAGVTVKTLRHYAAIGVLHPAQVDRRTGYRRYRTAQLPLLQKIRLLAGWGCTLAEIRALLELPSGDEAYQRQLESVRRRLMLDVARAERRLQGLDRWLLGPGAPAHDGLQGRRVGALPVFSLRDRVRSGAERVTEMFEHAERVVARQALRARRSPLLLLHDMEYRDTADIEVCIPVTPESLPACNGRLLEPIEAACARFAGGYAQAPGLCEQLLSQFRSNGLRIAGPLREVYLRFGAEQRGYTLPTRMLAQRESDYRTELQIPCKRA